MICKKRPFLLKGVPLLAICALVLPAHSVAQWTSGATGTISYNGGNVGIGTTAPVQQLQLTNNMLFPTAVSNASGNLFFAGDTAAGNIGMRLFSADNFNGGYIDVRTSSTTKGLNFRVDTDNGATTRMVISAAGNVGIGTLNPQYMLSVNGTVQAKEVLVNTGWADYVFSPSYHLAPLEQVASYIKRNERLPDMPSEAEVRQKGIGVGDMESKLLAKVEELTLHVIELNESNKKLAEQNRQLAARVSHLEAAQ